MPEWSDEQVIEIAFQVAGAASIPFLKENPDMVMPTEEIIKAVENVLNELGIKRDNFV